MAVAHVVGGLTLDEGRMFRSHLLECTACRARVGELRAIAHDLADVERDERRERAAQRTETKEREGEAAEPAPPTGPRVRWRTTVVVIVALGALMALSSWNFVLRTQIDAARQLLSQHREAVKVLQDGTRWTIVQEPDDGAGTVSTLDGEMVLVVDGLTDEPHVLYLRDEDLRTIGPDPIEPVRPTDGALFFYLPDGSRVDEIDNVLVVRSDRVRPDPQDAGPTVFEAELPDEGSLPPLNNRVEPEFAPVGASGP
jgi:hypothetical protein